jgi:hypothetical protein
LTRIGNHQVLFEKSVIWIASIRNMLAAKTIVWSQLQPPSTLVSRKRIAKKARWTAYHWMSMKTRKKKSRRNSIARLNEKRTRCA